jgi:hypothetical protein
VADGFSKLLRYSTNCVGSTLRIHDNNNKLHY